MNRARGLLLRKELFSPCGAVHSIVGYRHKHEA